MSTEYEMKGNTHYLKWIIIGFGVVVFTATVLADQARVQGPYYQEKEEKSKKKFSQIEGKVLKELKQLSAWCEKNSLNYERQHVAQTMVTISPENEEAKKLLEGKKKDDKVLPLEKRALWANDFQKTCEKFSKQYSDLAKWCKSQKLEEAKERAIDLSLKLDPENKAAREMHAQAYIKGYGWLDVETAKKIASGKREFNGKWISKEERDTLGKDWKNAWELKNEHFTIKTNTSEQEGLEMLAAAEELYDAFTWEIGRYIEVKECCDIVLNYYATRADYLSNIPSDAQQNKNASGCNQGNSVYFCKEPIPGKIGEPKETLRHETTHSFCTWTRLPRTSNSGAPDTKPNFWLVEGIAIFIGGGYKKIAPFVYELGTPNSFYSTTIADIAGGKFTPLSEFTMWQREKFAGNLNACCQGYILTHYLFTAESGKYRIGLCNLLETVHSGKAEENSFEKVIGVKPSELDDKMRAHAQKLIR
jgi:hypothetical protein